MYIIVMDFSNGSLHIHKTDSNITFSEAFDYIRKKGFNEDEISYMIVEKLHLDIE